MATLTSAQAEAQAQAQPMPSQGGAPEQSPSGGATRTRSELASAVGNVLMLAGILVMAFAGYLTVGSRLQEAHSQHLLFDQLKVSLEHATAPVADPIAAGSPVALLDSPRLGADQVVVEGTSSRDLMRGPGHRSDTPLPGQRGVSVIFGRSSTFGSPFRRLSHLVDGDRVSVTTGQGSFTYRIDSVRRSDQPFRPLAGASARLSLVTSDGSWTPDHVWVASGVLVAGTAQPVPSALGPAVPAEQALQGDPGAAVALLLWAQALLVVAALGAWVWRRLPRITVWVGLAPVLIAVVWNVFSNLSALPPNLL